MSDNHRHCYLFTGSSEDTLSDFLHLSQHLSTPLIVTHDVSLYQEKHADLLQGNTLSLCTFKQARQHLGRSHEAVLLDLQHGVSASALTILAGTVRGHGLFAIALPEDGWCSMTDQDLTRYLPWPYQPEQVTSYFKRYLLERLYQDDSPFLRTSLGALPPLPALAPIADYPALTQEQRQVQHCLLAAQAKAYVLIAPRGRGKSTLLGDTLAKLLQNGKKVAVTAPNQEAIKTLKQRFVASLTNSEQTFDLPFIAPDALILTSSDTPMWDYLFVDEASMLPLPMLKALSKIAIHNVFSTTDYGYEGAGKGFGLRFCRFLAHQKIPQHTSSSPIIEPLQRLTLVTPVRWGGNDPLENWVNATFFLTPSDQTPRLSQSQSHEQSTAPQKKPCLALTGADWLAYPQLLAQAFHLLVSAHYQTSPDNVRWVMDDPSVTTYLSINTDQACLTDPQHPTAHDHPLNSVAIVTEEGDLPEALSQAVLQGTRRPRGHLLPQSLLAHEGIEEAGHYRYWRISRIATNPDQQRQGVASDLLTAIEEVALPKVDFLCTSFAATTDVVMFWLKNGYRAVRLGTSKDQASGSYSLMMVKPLNDDAKQRANQWHKHFVATFSINILLQYADLPTELIILLLQGSADDQDTLLSPHDRRNILLFVEHHRPFDSIRPSFLKAVLTIIGQKNDRSFHPELSVLLEAALGRDTEASRQAAHLSGKKAMMAMFKTQLSTLLESK
ncbi:GNAT family N-acetyltransferase [Marinomonas algarum]|uniref:tRNA(Met) cytidine acetyltransferase TmcA n=1 Tax=Marinomonas algarum TaxID=2883105 RepID=A0A9X1IR35_9GAMM|nr:GNAT family N-acetyltransferase [Marinomonas algarum]MCB5162706.1 GNAT family N-acetyltransferase [Marinomonas algarum]